MSATESRRGPDLPFGVDFDLVQGIMKEPSSHVVRRASGMRGYYRDARALEALIAQGDPVHYETFERAVTEKRGNLMFCISRTNAGTVGQECFMTKGHYHAVPETAEIYLCLRGDGWMVMKLPDGTPARERLTVGRLVYVPPFWAHRTVNTGDEALVSLCIYPAEAGHNYGDIEKEGFPQRVYRRNGKVEFVSETRE
ncbi:MAG TPA: glucose-6-phosphate isomerase family protein [Spirochaetia bacterium]|nr:glucose-6-phosphate isomerase family protein [Spirochaetia bacterium]